MPSEALFLIAGPNDFCLNEDAVVESRQFLELDLLDFNSRFMG